MQLKFKKIFQIKKFKARLIFFLLMVPSLSIARWANVSDAESIVEKRTINFEIDNEGAFTSVLENSEQILKESARSQIGTLRINYSPMAASVEILEATSALNGLETKLEPKYIADKAISIEDHGFDNSNQLVGAFNDVRIGTIIKTKIKYTQKIPVYKGIFSDRQILGSNSPVNRGEFKYVSKLPIEVEVNDPESKLEIIKSQINDKYVIEVKTKASIFNKIVDEEKPVVNSDKLTWFVVSSAKSYADISKSLVDRYESVLDEHLPPKFEKILNLAKLKMNQKDQINVVTSELAEMMRYVGDWRAVDGGMVPRKLSVIESSLFGDCKDFAIVTTAILRNLNMDANVAVIERGEIASKLPKTPFSIFNHAIVSVKTGDQYLWIDPTNLTSFSQGVFEDIIDRPALIIRKLDPEIYKVPEGIPSDSIITRKNIYSFKNDGTQEIEVNVISQGRVNTQVAGIGLYYSDEIIKNRIMKSFFNENEILEQKIDPIELKSRIVEDVKLNLWVKKKTRSIKTAFGNGVQLGAREGLAKIMALNSKNREADYFLGYPTINKESKIFRNISVRGKQSPTCKIESSWINATRIISNHKKEFKMDDEITIKKAFLSSEDIKSFEFAKLQQELKNCFEDQYVIYSVKN